MLVDAASLGSTLVTFVRDDDTDDEAVLVEGTILPGGGRLGRTHQEISNSGLLIELVFEYCRGMTSDAVTTSGGPSRPHLPGFPDVDLDALQAVLAQTATVVDEASSDAELVDRMTRLATLRSSLEALQATTELSFARVHAAKQTATGQVDPERLERSIGAMIGLAERTSTTVGCKRMRIARDLHDGLDHVRGLFTVGEIDEYRVSIIVDATAHLDRADRAAVDRRLADRDLPRLGARQLRSLVRAITGEVAPTKFRQRCTAARSGRRVTIRQAPDGMVNLTAHLPVEQGVACYTALHKAYNRAQVSREPLTRGRGQVLADTLVERVTGQATAEHVDVEVQVMVPVAALLDENSPLPAEIPGYGPVPVELLTGTRGRRALRRLLTRAGTVIGGDSQSRCFPDGLAELIHARDHGRCTEPYCDAPARQTDHIIRAADGGPTAFSNGRDVCELHNHLREQPGWWVEPTADGTCTTTPTGHSYVSSPYPAHGP